jgi:hypothetical protein
MANLTEAPNWEPGIYQLEESDPVQGGANGIDNLQAKQLANRTKFLKRDADALRSCMVESEGRNLLTVLGVSTIPAAMAELRRRCNNNGEIDSSKVPDFSGIMLGDYIDGMDLSGTAAAPGGTAPGVWNDTYKNNRIIVAGFNTYKGGGETENTKNHIIFMFRNIICTGHMKATYNTTEKEYYKTEMLTWLRNILATKIRLALGGDFICTIQKQPYEYWYNEETGEEHDDMMDHTVWLPSEVEVFGRDIYGSNECAEAADHVQLPIFAQALWAKCKQYNDTRWWNWWLSTPVRLAGSPNSAYFAGVNCGRASYTSATYALGISPAFCVS